MSYDTSRLRTLMAEAVEFCVRHVESGGLPFVGMLVADDGTRSDPGVNLVRDTGDPSAHAETVAMRHVLRRSSYDALGTDQLPIAETAQLLAVERRLEPFERFLELHGNAPALRA